MGLRVALVLEGPSFEGPVHEGDVGHDVVALAQGLVRAGVELYTVCPPEVAEAFETVGATVTPLAVGLGVAAVAALRHTLRETGVDVIQANGLRAALAAMLARPGGTPLVVGWTEPVQITGASGLARRALARTVAAGADLTLAASEELVGVATRLGARDARLAPVVAPELPAPLRPRDEVREDLGVTGPMVLAVGRLQPRSHHEVLVAAAARWRDRRPVPQVVLVGTGPSYRDLVAQVAVTRAPVIFAGARDDITDLLAAADLAVVTGDRVRAPFALQAARAGVPVVASGGAGLADVLDGAVELLPAGDVDALDQAVRALLDNPPGRAVLAAAGQVRAAAWPGVDAAVDEIVAAYTAVVDDARDAPGTDR